MSATGQKLVVPTTGLRFAPRVLHQVAELGQTVDSTDQRSARSYECDGTLVFGDISGFTALSERLARKGRIGSELINRILTISFSAMLDLAESLGGDLVSFGGDALCLFFEGDRHEQRGVATAAGLRAALRRTASQRAPIDNGTLRISTGVHSGPVLFGLVGTSIPMLVTIGPTLSSTLGLESAAAGGEVLVSGETVRRLNSQGVRWAALDQHPTFADGFLLRSVDRRRMPWLGLDPAGEQNLATAINPSTKKDPESSDKHRLDGVDPAIRSELAHGRLGLEHRPATIGFLKYSGIDAQLSSTSLRHVVQNLHQLTNEIQRAAAEHRVTIISTDVDQDGGKFMLATGVPLASGLEHDRMLAFTRAVLDGGSSVRCQIGVNAGRIFAGPVGSSHRASYTALGDTVNTAARMTAKANYGHALIAPVVLASARTTWDATPIEPFAAKGKAAPVQASELGQQLNRVQASQRAVLPFVGRNDELLVIDAAIEQFRAGHSALVELVGDPGLGKSRLIDETLWRLGDLRVIRVNASPLGSTQGYLAIQSELRLAVGLAETGDVSAMLRSLVRSHLPDEIGLLPLLGAAFGCVIDETVRSRGVAPQFRARVTSDLVTRLLDACIGNRDVVLVLDDTHWLDEASCGVVNRLLDDPERCWFVLCARRAQPSDLNLASREGLAQIDIDRLDDAAAQQMAEAFAIDTALSDNELRSAVDRADGNPLVLELILEALVGGAAMSELPMGAEQLVAARFDALPHDARSVLRAASVLGSDVSTSLLARLLRTSAVELETSLEDVTDYLLPEGIGAYRFRHAMIRETAYAGLAFAERRRLHADVVAAVESGIEHVGDTTALLAAHAVAAKLHTSVWQYARAASLRAKQQGLLAQSAELATASLEAARHLVSVDPILIGAVAETLGDVDQLRGRSHQADRAFAQALRHVTAKLDRSRLMWKRSGSLVALQRYVAADRVLDQVLNELADDRSTAAAELRADVLTSKAGIRYRRSKPAAAIRLLNEAWPSAELANDDARRARINFILGAVETDRGSRHAEFYISEAVRLLRGSLHNVDLAKSLNNLGYFKHYNGRWSEALVHYEDSARAAAAAGDVQTVATVHNNIAEILSDQHKLEAAEQLFRSALRTFQFARFNVGISLVLSNLGRVHSRRGEFEVARKLVTEAARGFADIGLQAYADESLARLAETELFAGNYELAIAQGEPLAKRVRTAGENPPLEAMLARVIGAAMARSAHPAAKATLLQGLSIAEAFRARYDEVLLHEELASLSKSSTDHQNPEAGLHRRAADALRVNLGLSVSEATLISRTIDETSRNHEPLFCQSGRSTQDE